MCLSFGGSRRTVTVAGFSSVTNLRPRTTVLVTGQSLTPGTPGAWTALPADPATVGNGNWIQAVADQPGLGRLGFAAEWAVSNGSAFSGTWTYYDPALTTGWFRVWNAADVVFESGTVVDPSRYLSVTGLQSCRVEIDGVDCYGSVLRATNCRGCTFVVKNVSGRIAESFKNDRAVVAEDGGSDNTFILENVEGPGCVFRSDRAQRTIVKGTNVSGMAILGDMGVIYIGGRDTMTRRAVISGEFIVNTLEANLVLGANKRNRIYLDDFSFGHRCGPLTLTADDSDYSVNIGGGSQITVTTAGTHLNEDRDAFTTEYAAWFPGVSAATGVVGWIGPRSNSGQNTIAT